MPYPYTVSLTLVSFEGGHHTLWCWSCSQLHVQGLLLAVPRIKPRPPAGRAPRARSPALDFLNLNGWLNPCLCGFVPALLIFGKMLAWNLELVQQLESMPRMHRLGFDCQPWFCLECPWCSPGGPRHQWEAGSCLTPNA